MNRRLLVAAALLTVDVEAKKDGPEDRFCRRAVGEAWRPETTSRPI